MKTLLFLLLCCGLGPESLAAQVPPAGPWRVTYRLVQDNYGDWGSPAPANKAAPLRKRRFVSKAFWDVNPDSIRLFLACENPLTAPPAKAAIRFTATGATLRLDARQRLLWLVPSAPVVVLQAYQEKQLLFSHEFRAVAPPPPMVKCYVSGDRDADDIRPEDVGKHNVLTLMAVPDRDFATLMPEDARYRVAQFRATVIRAGKAETSLLINGPQGNISELHFTDETGGELQVDILRVQRQNCRGEVSEASLPLKSCFVVPSQKP